MRRQNRYRFLAGFLTCVFAFMAVHTWRYEVVGRGGFTHSSLFMVFSGVMCLVFLFITITGRFPRSWEE